MPPLQVKECPDEVYERLRKCAAEENRSISNQALTIIEDYLDARDRGLLAATPRGRGCGRIIMHRKGDDTDWGAQRRKVFERIDSREPIPISEDRPRADVILRQIREEEMR